MPAPDRQVKPEIYRSEQAVQNWSFDEVYKVLAVIFLAEYNGALYRLQANPDGTLVSNSSSYALRYDEGATYTYIGEAAPGTSEGAVLWRIKRLTNSNNTITWADGTSAFTKEWDERASYSYS